MFDWIWNNRPHTSFISGKPITNPTAANFAHVLPKGLNQFPEFRLNPDNVVITLYEEHFLIDQGSDSQRRKYADLIKSADFTAYELLKSRLLKEYEEMFGGLKK